MKVLITGGTGFIGKYLCPYLIAKGYELTILTRDILKAQTSLNKHYQYIDDIKTIQHLPPFSAVINLAGSPIADSRWTDNNKKIILESRVELTKNLVAQLSTLKVFPKVFISGSAIGYYGPNEDVSLSESSKYQDSFSHTICENWEQAALQAKQYGARVCLMRTGVVLGKGGMLAKLRLPYKLGLGGVIGSGQQWLSWIHINDMVRVIEFCLKNNSIDGAVNACAPNPVRNKQFTVEYANTLKRITFLKTPAWIMRLIFGQMAEELLLSGQKVMPSKLLEQNFSFSFANITNALQEIEDSWQNI